MLKNIWKLGKIIFEREGRWKNIFAISLILILELATIYFEVIINKWQNYFFTALQNYEIRSLYIIITKFILIISSIIFISAFGFILKEKLYMKWRILMSRKFLDKWTNKEGYFGLNLIKTKTDNPDQRISEDIQKFVSSSLDLSLGFINSVISVISFAIILWNLSGTLDLTFKYFSVKIKAYLIWIAIFYAAIGTIITYNIGRKLSRVNYEKERKEADFRFAMMRIRENSESIALYKGKIYETNIILETLKSMKDNFMDFIIIRRNLSLWNDFYNNIIQFLPYFASIHKYFAKEITFGSLMEIGATFGSLVRSLSFLIGNFSSLAEYKASIERLIGFEEDLRNWEKILIEKKLKISEHNDENLILKNLSIFRPNGETLIENLNLNFEKAKSYLITGINGGGKTSLFKTINNLWPFAMGEIFIPANKKLFTIPQKIYIAFGNLAEIMLYPDEINGEIDINYLKYLLKMIGLDNLVDRWNERNNWNDYLSEGEKQKITILRIIFQKPDILFLDEITSALTEKDENIIYEIIRKFLPNTIIISIGHRSSLKKFHDEEIII